MAVVVAGGGGGGEGVRAKAAEQARLPWREQEPRSPDIGPPPRPPQRRQRPARAAVVYYLSRNGHLEHPHFMEIALSCPDGLYLRGTDALLCTRFVLIGILPSVFMALSSFCGVVVPLLLCAQT